MIWERILKELPQKLGVAHPEALAVFLRALPAGIVERLRRAALRETVRLSYSRSSFYRQQFNECRINAETVMSVEDLGDFYLSSETLRQSPELLLCARPELAIESSGTTGHAVRVFLSNEEFEYSARQAIVLKILYGISTEDRVLSTFDYGFCLDGLLAARAIPYWGVFSACVGRVDPTEIYRRLREYRFNIVMSGTPWLSRFTEVAQENGRPYNLKLLVGGGGGGILPRTREWIEKFWEAPLCMTYGLTEAATILGFECLRRDGYHLNEFDFFLEILNPDAEGYGEVVITTLSRKVMPLLRYKTKDLARIVEEPCPCGFPFRRLSPLRGRADEIVASVWGNVHPDYFSKILSPIAGITDDWQVALFERNGKQTFEFRLELENGSLEKEKVRARICETIEQEHPLAWQAHLQKLSDIDIVFFPKRTLRKGRKLLRLVDERQREKDSLHRGVAEGAERIE